MDSADIVAILLIVAVLVMLALTVCNTIMLLARIPTNTTEPKIVRIEPNTYAIQDDGGKWHLVRPITPPIKIESPEID